MPTRKDRFFVAAFLLVSFATICALVRSRPRPDLVSPVRPLARIPFEMNGNSIFLQLKVNGSAPVWFALDTGAYSSLINSTTAESLKLKKAGESVSQGAAGRVPNTTFEGITFDIGSVQLTGLSIVALPLAQIESSAGRKMDGILGAEFFRRFVVEIDYLKHEINVYDPADFNYQGAGEILPLSFYDNHPYVHATLLLPGRKGIDGEFVIDSGSNFPLILSPSFIAANNLRQEIPPATSVFGRGVGGELPMPLGRAETLQIGRFLIRRPVTALPQAGAFARGGKAGNIGTAILRRFKVTFDYSRSHVILEPNERFSDPYEFDMSGLQLTSEAPSFAVIRVNRVLPGSPAAEAGIQSGDEIIMIDERPVTQLTLASLRDLLRQPDKPYALRLKRGDKTVAVSLKTRRLI